MQKIIIVMPAWNEAENIEKMVKQLVEVEFPKIDAEMHLLVVDNYSKDNTAKIVEEASKKYKQSLPLRGKSVHIMQQGDKSGLGWAYVRGIQYAIKSLKADAVLEMDADFQHPTRFIKPMVEAYLAGADYAIGSRYVKGGSIPKEWQFSRRA
ncbi:MAG: glycosyltransferase, partial [Candidatus Woesebacteria bacterium]|nr:glycosyltransferase [Candidatus Woesebacteria bacterium]